MTADAAGDSAEELFEDAPCGYIACAADNTITRVNRTFERWTGRSRDDLVGVPFSRLLTAAGRIYHETHYVPLLRMQGVVREIAVDIVCADGSRMPCLLNASIHGDDEGRPRSIRTAVFDARDRRSYERELLEARRREQSAALELQRSLLPGEVPRSGEVDVDVYYRPAISTLEVGGDWYDAYWISDGRLALVIGDVVGRGIPAAASMGQLRSAIRALSLAGLAPGPLLERLDAFTDRHEVGRMTTVAYIELDVRLRCATYAIAGHPPPLIWTDGEPARFLEEARSPPLGASFRSTPREQASFGLAGRQCVALYTDGLVERRDRPLDEGFAALATAVEATRPGVAAEPLARQLSGAARDDVCLMVASIAVGSGPRAAG